MTRNLQRERQQRGEDFQDEMRRSWRLLENVWRFRIPDGRGGSRPGDEIILLEHRNILAEHKRTKGDRFQLDFLRPSQLKGLRDFDAVIPRNLGLVFVSFLNEDKGIDEAYAFRLIRALQFMKEVERNHITLDEFRSKTLRCIDLPLLPKRAADGYERVYDLEGVQRCYKSL